MPGRSWSGPIDEASSPETLDAHVVTPGSKPRVHGYDVEEDLAAHYGLVESFILALTGELPESWQTRAAEVALSFLSPAPVAEAPAHAAVVARICGGRTSAVLGVGAVTLAEQASAMVERHSSLFEWLRDADVGPPKEALAASEEDRLSVERLKAALAAHDVMIPALEHDLAREPGLLAVLFNAGLRYPEQVETLLVTIRLPCLMAEALSWSPRAIRDYPMDLPRFRYNEEREP